jgi:hypothetical protein
MLASYKLRLSDGTVLVVDHDGLSTWQVDAKAMVQLVGSTHWRPLKAFLAAERAAARNASRAKPSAGSALPLIPPPSPKEEPQRALPLIPPPSPKEETQNPVETQRPAEPPPSDPAQVIAISEPPAAPIWRENALPEPVDPGADPIWSAEASRRLEEVLPEALPRTSPQSPAEETPRHLAEPPPSDQVEPFFLDEPPAPAHIAADKPMAPRVESVKAQPDANELVPPIRLKTVDDDGGKPPADSPWSEPSEPRSVGVPPSLLVLADDLSGSRSENRAQTPATDDALPIIRLKPLDDQEEEPRAVAPIVHDAPPWQDPRDEKLFRTVASVGGFLSVWLSRLDRPLERLSSIRRPGGRMPRRRPGGERSVRLVAAVGGFLSRCMDRIGREPLRLPSISPGPTLHAASASDSPKAAPSLGARLELRVLAEELTDPPQGFTRDRATPVPGSSVLPKPLDPRQATQEPLNPPPPIRELPVLRLADIDEPQVADDVYEGESPIRTAWLWTKRVVVITGLLASGILGALTWETWLPKAERLSRILFAEIDKYAKSRDQEERRRRALQEATAQLPHIAPDTIALVLSGSVLDPPDVFRLACDAADRGQAALPPGEALELKALRQEMLDTLRSEERQRAREYDRARSRRLTLPLEDREVLDLFARGARALPPARRVRLQVLLGKAIAAGLVPDPPGGQSRPQAD